MPPLYVKNFFYFKDDSRAFKIALRFRRADSFPRFQKSKVTKKIGSEMSHYIGLKVDNEQIKMMQQTVFLPTVSHFPDFTILITFLAKQDSVLRTHSFAYVFPSEPQTGS